MTTVETTNVDFRERMYLSQFSTMGFGLSLNLDGLLSDADGNVSVTMTNEADNSVVFTRNAEHISTGVYVVGTRSAETSKPGLYTVSWNYSMGGAPDFYQTYVEVGRTAPAYDSLSSEMKDLLERTWIRFADLFDSPAGGPNLQTYFQTHYSRNRMATLLRIALGVLNTAAQPYQTYTLDGSGGAEFPIAKWGDLLERALYIECLKHLVRSYVEQPNVIVGGNVTRLDRRDYMDRWRMVLGDEESMFERQLEVFKISNMGLGRPSVLISGGVYGRYAPTRMAGSLAARPRLWTRWY